jgi:Spy/CpxP family protein refolding chaperone
MVWLEIMLDESDNAWRATTINFILSQMRRHMRCRPIQYVEYVREVTQHPDYDKAIEALKNVVVSRQKDARHANMNRKFESY